MTAFLFSFVPDFVFHLIVFVGIIGVIASSFFSFVPFISNYRLAIQVISIVLLVIGVWFEGGLSTQKDWELKVAEVEKKVLIAEAKSAEANVQLIEKIKDNEKLRKERQNATQNIITKVVKQSDSQCTLSNGFIRVHNSASQDIIPNGSAESDAGASDVKPSEFLTTVINNYSTCYDIREKLIGWQQWYKTQKAIYDHEK